MGFIYDLGLHLCEDTSYYLASGHTVLAVDANPELVSRARSHLQPYIDDHRLTLLNVAIAAKEEVQTFWVPLDNTQWGSLQRDIAARQASEVHSFTVEGTTLRSLMETYGTPDYIKIDLEGSDSTCLADLQNVRLPEYISVECECLPNADSVPTQLRSETLEQLHNLGYTRFKLIDQYTLLPLSPDHLLHDRQTYPASREDLFGRFGWVFPLGASGPWGEQLRGPWLSFAQAEDLFRDAKLAFTREEKEPAYGFWCDWHAARH